MSKKVLGYLFFAGAILLLIGTIANGTLFSDQGSTAATYGNFFGTLIPIIVYVLSGIFLITFDTPTKLNYIDGFKKRSKQCSKIVLFISIYVIFLLFSVIGVITSNNYNTALHNIILTSILRYIITTLPFILPLVIFVSYFQIYALTHNASKKFFINSDNELHEYLSTNEVFYAWSDDYFVLASNKVLYFPQLFCAIPFNHISSIEIYKQPLEQGVYINLSNGKKIYILTKHFDRIQEAINVNTQTQQ